MTLKELRKIINSHSSRKIYGTWDIFRFRWVELNTCPFDWEAHIYIREVVDKSAWIVYRTIRSDIDSINVYCDINIACIHFLRLIKETYNIDFPIEYPR